MDPKRIKVLVVDDQVNVRESLVNCFGLSTRFAFEVTDRSSPEDCVDLDLQSDGDFDVCIIDLGFDAGSDERRGNRLLAGLSCLRSSGLGIVYTGHPSVENAVRAVRLGAADFVAKSRLNTKQLVDLVGDMLTERRDQEVRRRCLSDYITEHRTELEAKYPGQTLAFAVVPDKIVLAAVGRSRLDALLKYSREVQDLPTGNAWPVDPQLYIVRDNHPG